MIARRQIRARKRMRQSLAEFSKSLFSSEPSPPLDYEINTVEELGHKNVSPKQFASVVVAAMSTPVSDSKE